SLAGKNEWIYQSGSQIKNLSPGTTYDLRYRGQCNPPSNYKYKQFTTLCPKLATLTVAPSSYNTANVRWTSNYPGNAILEYSADNVTWTSIGADLTLQALVLGKQYFVRGSMA